MPPRRLSRSHLIAVGAREHRAESARRGDQARRLLVHHLQVVLDRIRPLGDAAGLAHLPGHQLGERLGDEPHRLRPQPRHQPRRRGEQIVAGQDRDVVAPAHIGGGRAAAHLRLVHHVVVVERGQVHQFDDRAGDRHLPGVGVRSDLRGQHGEQRPEPLAAGLEQVRQRVGHHLVGAAQLGVHELLDPPDTVAHGRGERGVAEVNARHHRRRSPHPTNILVGVETSPGRRGGRGRRTCRFGGGRLGRARGQRRARHRLRQLPPRQGLR